MPLNKARFCSALLALSAFAAPALAADLTFAAASNPVQQGNGVDVRVLITGISDLSTYQFSVSFDPSLFQVTSVTEGSFLGTGGTTFSDGGSIDNSAGTISYVFNTLIGPIAGVSGSGTLATIHLNAIGVGTSALTFSDTLFLNSQSLDIAVQTVNGSLAVTAVPEPSTYLMLVAGLAGIGALRRRQANV
ncbi:cohesin domain-containing protein [Roseateles sp.]|uniref:cohesin domain-containing protein n=1 Tax=Roseateles sp. TaxID=1971397 RepID=UPI003BAC156C